MKMTGTRFGSLVVSLAASVILATSVEPVQAASKIDGEGIDSQLLWPTPGPSHFPTLESSDIIMHKGVTFSALFGYQRRPLGVENTVTGKQLWVVNNQFGADFMWAFGIVDMFQLGVVLPVILEQDGVGATPFKPQGIDDADYTLSSSALRDLRFHIKTRFLGGKAEIPDQRDFGLALDLGLAVPTGDELNFAGDEGVVFFPTAVFDFHRCMFSAALNVGARLRFADPEKLANLSVGHQGVLGLGVTGHFLDRRLLLSLEGVLLVEFEGFDRMGFEYRGAIGYIPDEAKSVTLWVAGGSSAGTGDLLGTPIGRAMIGLTYSPSSEDDELTVF